MQRYVGRITHHPTVVAGRSGWNVEEHAGAEFVVRAVLHRSGGTAGEHHPNMLDVAARRPDAGPDVNGPLPSGLVGVARPMVMPPMRTSSNFPFSKVRTSSGSSKRFRTVPSILHSPVQPRDAKCVRRP